MQPPPQTALVIRLGPLPPVAEGRRPLGGEAVLDEAVRRGMPGWYEEAVSEAGITTVGDPSIDLNDLPEKGSVLAFTVEVGVVPPAKLGDIADIARAA